MRNPVYVISTKTCLYLSISPTHKILIRRILCCKPGLIPTQILASGSIIKSCTLHPIHSLKFRCKTGRTINTYKLNLAIDWRVSTNNNRSVKLRT